MCSLAITEWVYTFLIPKICPVLGSFFRVGNNITGGSNEPYPQLRHNAKITQKWRKVWGPSGILCMEGIAFRDVPREESMRKLW